MTTLHLPTWAWAATIAALAALLAADLIVSGRRRTPTRLREAASWTLASVLLALGFGAMLAALSGGAAAGQFYAGWLTEYSLSLDNLFVFILLIGSSGAPRQHHGRVLLLGILAALGLRGVFIGLGAAALRQFGWVEYVFGAFLLFTAAAMVWRRNRDDEEKKENAALRAARRVLPVADGYHGGRLTTRVGGRRLATPLLILVVAIGATDVMFAFDSIPAIFGLTRDPFLVFTANLFALLGLRHLYFLVGGLLSRLVHLAAGLSVILAFIGLKIIAEALRGSGVERLGPVPLPEVSPLASLAVIAGVLAITTVTSLAADSRARSRRQAADGPDVPAPPRTRGAGDRPAAAAPLVAPTAGLAALSSVISPGAISPSDISRAAIKPAALRASAAAGPVLRVVWTARTGADPVSQRPQALAPRRGGADGPTAEPAQGTLVFRPALPAGRERRHRQGPAAGGPAGPHAARRFCGQRAGAPGADG